MKNITRKFALALLLAVAACGGGGGDVEVSDTPLAGTVNGQPWTFTAGHTSAFLSEGEPDFFAIMHATQFEACGFSEPAGDHLIVSIPKTVGDYEMSLSQNMTFVVGDSNNLIATEGRIVVEEVLADKVRGKLHGIFDDDNEVDGKFEVTICAE
jgi:hypothetical protein